MLNDDGVTLRAISHPRKPWHVRMFTFWRVWRPSKFSDESLEEIEIDLPAADIHQRRSSILLRPK